MDCVLVTYLGNNSSRYDGKYYMEKLSKIRREEGAKEELHAGGRV
jgi:hypothetical protein